MLTFSFRNLQTIIYTNKLIVNGFDKLQLVEKLQMETFNSQVINNCLPYPYLILCVL